MSKSVSALPNFLVATIVTAIQITEPSTEGNSGPINLAVKYWGIKKLKPESNVIIPTPLNDSEKLFPLCFPTIATRKNGTKIFIMVSWTTILAAVVTGSRPVIFIAVTAGIPIEPKATGVVFATRQTTAAKRGSNPKATSIPAGIATAVPKPAIPSIKAPNPHEIINTRIRLSLDTDANICLMTSMYFVCTTRL